MTTMTTAIHDAATRLDEAMRTATPCAPVRDLIGAQDETRAYAVQERLTASRVAAGATVVGRKIGLTSTAVQQQLGVDQPDFGVLFDDMAFADGATLPMERLLQPKIEAEIAFVLSKDLADGPLDLDQARESVDCAIAAIEIVDSRVANWDIQFADTVADNASSGLYVLGNDRLSIKKFEPRSSTMTMSVNGLEASTGNGEACLGDPLLALLWLARKARQFDNPLRAGQVILSGALGPMVPGNPGDEVIATIGGLGTVSAKFGTAHHKEEQK